MMNELQKLKAVNAQIALLQLEKQKLESTIRSQVEATGPVQAHGLLAHFKPGRKSTDHEAAAKAANVDQSIIEKYSTTKVSVAWAKVTKEAKVNTKPYTIQGLPSFVIEEVESSLTPP